VSLRSDGLTTRFISANQDDTDPMYSKLVRVYITGSRVLF